MYQISEQLEVTALVFFLIGEDQPGKKGKQRGDRRKAAGDQRRKAGDESGREVVEKNRDEKAGREYEKNQRKKTEDAARTVVLSLEELPAGRSR